MKRVLITGRYGFTGPYLAAELEAHGWEVWGIGHTARPDIPRYQWVDLSDPLALRAAVAEAAPDAVVHLAAISCVDHSKANAFYQTNLIGTRNLLVALGGLAKKPRCVLLASSANVYGRQGGELDESTPPRPANDYAASKHAMETMAWLWADKLPIVIARPFNYTGVGQTTKFLLPKIVDHFRRKAGVIGLGNLDVWRDYSDVRSVIKAYRRLLEVCPVGETVNVCSGRTQSLREALEIAERISGHRLRVEVNPTFVRENEVNTLSGNPAKLRELIGDWQSPPLEDTLRWMLQSSSR